jgi:hypothetical protein
MMVQWHLTNSAATTAAKAAYTPSAAADMVRSATKSAAVDMEVSSVAAARLALAVALKRC